MYTWHKGHFLTQKLMELKANLKIFLKLFETGWPKARIFIIKIDLDYAEKRANISFPI